MVATVQTQVEFERAYTESTITCVDFTASWCGPCQGIAPLVDQLAQQYTGVTFVKVDVDNEDLGQIVNAYKIEAMPTFIFLDSQGQVTARFSGANSGLLTQHVQSAQRTVDQIAQK